MSLFRRSPRPSQERLFGITNAGDLIPQRGPVGALPASVTSDTALRHSAVWACLRLRADLISTLPLDVFRRVAGVQVEMPPAPVLVQPGGERVGILEWLYSTQVDLDRCGNTFGLITERNGAGLPARIDLQPIGDCSVREKDGVLKYRIGRKEYDPSQVWHEKQFTVAGLAVGLSPVAYAAWSISQYQSATAFALDWYAGGGVPKMSLQNTERTIGADVASEAKRRYKASIEGRDVFVHGKDWALRPINAEAVGAAWLDSQQAGVLDVARFFGVPADLIDAAANGKASITYANISQRNLQLLIMNLGPAIYRRERMLSTLLPAPRYVKLNSASLLRMDPLTQATVIGMQLDKRVLTPTEARELYDRPPLTPLQHAEFVEIYGKPRDIWPGGTTDPAADVVPAPADVPPIGAP